MRFFNLLAVFALAQFIAAAPTPQLTQAELEEEMQEHNA